MTIYQEDYRGPRNYVISLSVFVNLVEAVIGLAAFVEYAKVSAVLPYVPGYAVKLVGVLMIVFGLWGIVQILTLRRARITVEPGLLIIADDGGSRRYRLDKSWTLNANWFYRVGGPRLRALLGMPVSEPISALTTADSAAANQTVVGVNVELPAGLVPTLGMIPFRPSRIVLTSRGLLHSCVVIKDAAGGKVSVLPTNQPEALIKALQEATA
jgi:hypothetical protein